MIVERVILHMVLLALAVGLALYKWEYPTNWLHRASRILLAFNVVGALIYGVQVQQVGVFLLMLVVALISAGLLVQLNRQRP